MVIYLDDDTSRTFPPFPQLQSSLDSMGENVASDWFRTRIRAPRSQYHLVMIVIIIQKYHKSLL